MSVLGCFSILLEFRYSKNPRVRTYFFRVWQNRFLYFGVLTGILGEVGS